MSWFQRLGSSNKTCLKSWVFPKATRFYRTQTCNQAHWHPPTSKHKNTTVHRGTLSGTWPFDCGSLHQALLADTPGCANAADLHELFDILDPYLAADGWLIVLLFLNVSWTFVTQEVLAWKSYGQKTLNTLLKRLSKASITFPMRQLWRTRFGNVSEAMYWTGESSGVLSALAGLSSGPLGWGVFGPADGSPARCQRRWMGILRQSDCWMNNEGRDAVCTAYFSIWNPRWLPGFLIRSQALLCSVAVPTMGRSNQLLGRRARPGAQPIGGAASMDATTCLDLSRLGGQRWPLSDSNWCISLWWTKPTCWLTGLSNRVDRFQVIRPHNNFWPFAENAQFRNRCYGPADPCHRRGHKTQSELSGCPFPAATEVWEILVPTIRSGELRGLEIWPDMLGPEIDFGVELVDSKILRFWICNGIS